MNEWARYMKRLKRFNDWEKANPRLLTFEQALEIREELAALRRGFAAERRESQAEDGP